MEGKNMWETQASQDAASTSGVEKPSWQKHPEQKEDEIFLGMFEDSEEAQEEDDREQFEAMPYKTKRRGTKINGRYPVFVNRSEFEEE